MVNILDFEHIEGIPYVSANEKVKMKFLDGIYFSSETSAALLKIDYISIDDVEILTEGKRKEKSVIGRAIVGGLIFGQVGAIVGGISGLGTKSSPNYYLQITYDWDKTVILKPLHNSKSTCEKAKNLILNAKNGKM